MLMRRGFPRREVANGMGASLLFLLAFHAAGDGMPLACLIGCATWLGGRLLLGTDATSDDLYAGMRGLEPQEAARIMDSGEAAMQRLGEAASRFRDEGLKKALLAALDEASKVMDDLKSVPARIPRARRFVDIYLSGLVTVSERWAKLPSGMADHEQRQDMMLFLGQAEEACLQQRKALVADEQFDLSISIDVLRKRMTSEAVLVK